MTLLSVNDASTVLQLTNAFNHLTQQLNDNNKLIIEEEKLRIIQLLETIIKKKSLLENTRMALNTDEKITHTLAQVYREALYYFLLTFGLFEDAAGSYLFGATLFALIPGISNPCLIIASLMFTLLSCVLFYAFEVTFIKEALGIPYTSTDSNQLLDTYSKQLKATIALNERLSTLPMLSINNALYSDYVQLLKLFNQDLRLKHAAMGPYPESFLKNGLNIAVLAFGALFSIAGSYFMASALLTLVAPSLIGTLIGWTLISLTILSGLGLYYAMKVKSMSRLANPDFDSYHQLKGELDQFEKTYHDDLNAIATTKGRFFERKPMQDASTQTDDAILSSSSLSCTLI